MSAIIRGNTCRSCGHSAMEEDGRRHCHERVHSAALFGQGPQGPQMVNQTTYFPMVADQMWCGHWRSTLIHAAVQDVRLEIDEVNGDVEP